VTELYPNFYFLGSPSQSISQQHPDCPIYEDSVQLSDAVHRIREYPLEDGDLRALASALDPQGY